MCHAIFVKTEALTEQPAVLKVGNAACGTVSFSAGPPNAAAQLEASVTSRVHTLLQCLSQADSTTM